MPHNDDDWNAHRLLVTQNQTLFREGLDKLTERVRSLELQAAKYGIVSGALASLAVELVKYALHKP